MTLRETESIPGRERPSETTAGRRDRATADKIGLLVDSATNYAIYMIDPDGRVASWNRGAERIKGWSEGEIIGRSISVFYLPEDVAAGKPMDNLRRARADGRMEEESWRVRKDGSPFLANVTVTALYDEGNVLRGFGKVIRDITDEIASRRAIGLRERQLDFILENTPDAIVGFDQDGRITDVSHKAEQLFGRAESELIDQSIRLLLADPDAAIGFGRQVPRLQPQRLTGIRRDGSTFPMELVLGDADPAGRGAYTAFVRDVTERERTEAELERLQAELLRQARVSAIGAMGSTLAHELNQPISAAINYAQAARDLIDAPGAGGRATIVDALDQSIAEALRAGNILRQLRSFVARGEIEKRMCDLAELIRETCAMVAAGLREQQVTVRLRLDPCLAPVLVERVQIQQVLLNLIRNGAEAMASADRRILTITARPTAADTMAVTVGDTGAGIAPEMEDRLFDAFASDKALGLGLGLSICRTIVEAHGGRILAHRQAPGTRFEFSLPAVSMEGA